MMPPASHDFRQLSRRYIERGVGGSRVGAGRRPAVVVVDLQTGFTDPSARLGGDLDDVVVNCRTLVDAARVQDVPIVYTLTCYMPNMIDAGVWARKAPALADLTLEGPWTRLDDRLTRSDRDIVVTKQYPSAFFSTSLSSSLRALGIDTLIVAGATTSGCVRATVVDAMQYGFRTLVPRECVGDRDPSIAEASLFDIDAKYADVISLDDAIALLSRASDESWAAVPERSITDLQVPGR